MTVLVLNVRDGYEDAALEAIGRLFEQGIVSAVHKVPPQDQAWIRPDVKVIR